MDSAVVFGFLLGIIFVMLFAYAVIQYVRLVNDCKEVKERDACYLSNMEDDE